MKATDFSLPDQIGNIHTLSDYVGKWVILYFYPRDDTPGCVKEACSFRDNLDQLQKKNVVVLGVSKDSVESHKKFAKKYRLNFSILSDENKDVLKKYKAWGKKKFMGREYEGTYRMTYLISPEGKIYKVYPKVNPLIHTEELLKDIPS